MPEAYVTFLVHFSFKTNSYLVENYFKKKRNFENMSNLARRIVTKIPKRALFQMNVRKLFSNLKFYLIHF